MRKLHSDRLHRILVRCLLLLILLLDRSLLYAQEGRITLTGMAGPSILSFAKIDEDGKKDIAIYNQRGIPIADYAPLRMGFSAEGQLEYRFDRDIAVNLFVQYTRSGTDAVYSDSAQYLSLERTITSMDAGIDISYYFPPLVYGAEGALFLGLGRLAGRAEQKTDQTHKQKSADTTITIVDQEAFAEYTKTKLYVRAGGKVTVPLFDHVWLHAQVVYKFAPLGELDGTLREFSLVRPHTTTVEFDFSTIDIKVGLSYVFD